MRRPGRHHGGQASAKTAVTVTLTCWLPGDTGTALPAEDRAAAPNTGTGSTGLCSDMLTSAPRERPSALAY